MLDAPNAQNKSSEKKFYASNFHNRYAGKYIYVSVFQKSHLRFLWSFNDMFQCVSSKIVLQ